MKKKTFLIAFMFFTVLSLSAQNYSPCYTSNMANGDAAFKQGKYSDAKTYYANAKKCAGGNPTAAQQKINSCDAKIKAQKEAAEAKRKAEEYRMAEEKRQAEKAAQERIAEEKRKAEEELYQRHQNACRNTVNDYDGNTYKTILIGRQCWMAENLRTTHYADGMEIADCEDKHRPSACCCCPNNSGYNVAKYGYLYNWHAVMHHSSTSNLNPSGVQGVCPDGWHVPSDAEWKQLIDFVCNQSQYLCGGKRDYFAKSLASKTNWKACEGSRFHLDNCSVCDDSQSNNTTGFSALPAGHYYDSGGGYYTKFGESAYFWTSTASDDISVATAYVRTLSFDVSGTGKSVESRSSGCSVRCIKD